MLHGIQYLIMYQILIYFLYTQKCQNLETRVLLLCIKTDMYETILL